MLKRSIAQQDRISQLKAKLAKAEKDLNKACRVTALVLKDKTKLQKDLQQEKDLQTIFKNSNTVGIQVNQALRKELDQSQINVRHLSESYLDVLARNYFLENRNTWYYANFHGLTDEEINGPAEDLVDRPPSLGPL